MFNPNVIQYADYFPFGMTIQGKNGGSEYRYGFNGMEEDKEVKGDNNSYDFGARIYDPRIGRWLSCDAVSAKKPDLSPYQGFRNNPIVFIDPDGNDEWNSIILKDQEGNIISKATSRISTLNIMSSGVMEVSDGGGGWFRMSNGYDFSNTMTFQVQSDGSIKHTSNEQVILKKHGIKDREYGPFAKKKGTVYSKGLSGGFEMPGGMYFYSKSGENTKYYTREDVQGMEVDWLLTLIGVLGKSDFKNLPTEGGAVMNAVNNLKSISEETEVLPQGEKNYGVQSNQKTDENRKVHLIELQENNEKGTSVTPIHSDISTKEAELYKNAQKNKSGDTITVKKKY